MTTNNIVRFEAGKRYWDTSAVDHEDVMVIEITRRTEKSVWFVRVRNGKPDGEPARTKIYTDATREYIMPYKHSMAPVWEADRKVEPEAAAEPATETETPDAVQEAETADSAEPRAEDDGAANAPQEADVDAMAWKLAFLCRKHNEMMERAHYAERDSAEETDALKSGDRLYKAIRNAVARLRGAGAEVRLTDGDYPYYHITDAVVKLGGRIIAAAAQEDAAPEGVESVVAESETTPNAGEVDALEVARILGETLNLIKDKCNEVEMMKARIALWEQVDEFKRNGVTLAVEYDADGRFVGVTEPKAGMKFDELPESVQAKVKEYLRAYDDCSVTYERGSYRVSAGTCIKADYAPDFKVCGRYAATDIFTEAERVLNYANSFYGYPPEYSGKRDYRMMKDAQERGAKLGYDSAGNICADAAPEQEPQASDAPKGAETPDGAEVKRVSARVVRTIRAARGDAAKLETLRRMVNSIARDGRLSAEARHIEDYIAYVFRGAEDVLEAFDLYYSRATEETAQHFGWLSETPDEPATEAPANEKILEAVMEFLEAKMCRFDDMDALSHLFELCKEADACAVDVIAVEKSIIRHFVKLYGADGWEAYRNFRANFRAA